MSKDDKYDRQVRLWGGHGQKCLSDAKVLVLGTSAAATETLKNLVLPGIGEILIVDDHITCERDLG
jgi:amyloid beta precursor protein binding protein 1